MREVHPHEKARRRLAPAQRDLVRVRRVRSWAALERPLLVAGLALVTVHLLDLALSGPDTTAAGVAAVVLVPVAALTLQPRVSRATRIALAVPLGVLIAAAGTVGPVLGLLTSGLRWTDATGIAFALGGVALVAAGGVAAVAPARQRPGRSRARRIAHGLAWLAGGVLVAQFAVVPFAGAIVITHAVRLPVDRDALAVPHRTVRIDARGDRLAAWWVASRNCAAVLVVHGSGSNRAKVAAHVELLARHGYGVLALDLPGHGQSGGNPSLLGANAKPAVRAAIDWLARRPGVNPGRIAALGTSLGGEVLLEAAADDPRLQAVVSDGAERASDDRRLGLVTGLARPVDAVGRQVLRGVSGLREPPPLLGLVGRIAPRPVLLIAAGGRRDEIPVNRAYRRAAGPTAQLWEIPEAGHARGVSARPAEYERRVSGFLRDAVGARRVSGRRTAAVLRGERSS